MNQKFMTFEETMEFLRLSRPTIDRMIVRGDIPSYKVGRRRLFDRDELIEWVKEHKNSRVKTKAKVKRSPKKK